MGAAFALGGHLLDVDFTAALIDLGADIEASRVSLTGRPPLDDAVVMALAEIPQSRSTKLATW